MYSLYKSEIEEGWESQEVERWVERGFGAHSECKVYMEVSELEPSDAAYGWVTDTMLEAQDKVVIQNGHSTESCLPCRSNFPNNDDETDDNNNALIITTIYLHLHVHKVTTPPLHK